MDEMKMFRDKQTGKRYVEIDGNILEVVNRNGLDLEEVGAEGYTYKYGSMIYDDKSIDEVAKFGYQLKDTLDVPVDGKIVRFVVEHINATSDYSDVYFVARDIIGKSNVDDMNKFLDDLTDKMPTELVDKMKEIEHIATVDEEVFKSVRKVNLLSLANFIKTDYHSGRDDILFDGLQTEAERCKNKEDGETDWYWTCSPYFCNTTYFIYVKPNGYLYSNYESNVNGVVPCFSIRIYNGYSF